ncbi:MAG: DNA alkylation repair protein [Bacteroidales bacterium]|nr:DNA alkylation repair protein [Candidatus Physcousia equi]
MLTITDIKKEFRAAMNGVLSARMREAGAPYKLVFGIELPRLMQLALEVKQDAANDSDSNEQLRSLAQQLWHENIRESKLLATMIMPIECFHSDIADIWVDECCTDEVAQVASMKLFAQMEDAISTAFEWIATPQTMRQLCGYLILARLINNAQELNERSLNELRDQMESALPGAPLALRKAILVVESKISC